MAHVDHAKHSAATMTSAEPVGVVVNNKDSTRVLFADKDIPFKSKGDWTEVTHAWFFTYRTPSDRWETRFVALVDPKSFTLTQKNQVKEFKTIPRPAWPKVHTFRRSLRGQWGHLFIDTDAPTQRAAGDRLGDISKLVEKDETYFEEMGYYDSLQLGDRRTVMSAAALELVTFL